MRILGFQITVTGPRLGFEIIDRWGLSFEGRIWFLWERPSIRISKPKPIDPNEIPF